MVERKIDKMLKVLWSEYTSNVFNQFCKKKKGIMKEFNVPQTPKQNGVVEHKNQTLLKGVCYNNPYWANCFW